MIDKKTLNIFDYVSVILLIYLTGNPIFRMVNYQKILPIILVYFIIYASLKIKYNRYSQNTIYLFIILFLLVLIPCLLYDVENINTYVAIAMQLFISFLFVNSIDFKRFIDIFIKIMIVLCITSLIFYLLQFLIPSFPYVFPKHLGTYQLYSNAILYNYMLFVDGNSLFLFSRNTGIFWEPGAYQIFINLALFFYLSKFYLNKEILSFKNMVIVYLFTITIYTTKSTTGYIILIIIILDYFKLILKTFGFLGNRKINIIEFCYLASIVIIVLILLSNGEQLYSDLSDVMNKISSTTYMGENGFVERLSLDKFHFLFNRNGFYLFGMSFDKYYNFFENIPIWNSILEDTLCLGYLFSSLLLIGYYRFTKFFADKKMVLFLILLLGFSTEGLFRYVFFLSFVFFGYKKVRR